MPTRFETESLSIGPTATVVSVNNNTNAVVTLAAPVRGRKHVVAGGTISVSAAPLAAVSATVVAGARTIWRCEIPAALFAPITIPRLDTRSGEAVVITLPAVGGTTVATVSVLSAETNAQ
jgi:hypothetical protein